MKKHTIIWQKYDEFCDLCNEHHDYTICPNCKEEIWELDFHANSMGNVMCPNCCFVYAVIDRETLLECEHLDYALGCSHPYLLSHGLDWRCEECPLEPEYLEPLAALEWIKNLTIELLNDESNEQWGKWFAVYDLACKGLGECPIASTKCIEWGLKVVEELENET